MLFLYGRYPFRIVNAKTAEVARAFYHHLVDVKRLDSVG
jgi:hypothetical protein